MNKAIFDHEFPFILVKFQLSSF